MSHFFYQNRSQQGCCVAALYILPDNFMLSGTLSRHIHVIMVILILFKCCSFFRDPLLVVFKHKPKHIIFYVPGIFLESNRNITVTVPAFYLRCIAQTIPSPAVNACRSDFAGQSMAVLLSSSPILSARTETSPLLRKIPYL